MAELRSELEKRAGSAEAKTSDARNLVVSWVTEGQRLLGIIPRLLREHEQVAARADAAERKCERCEEETRRLRSENEHFRRERRQTAEALKALTRQLIESAGEMPSTRS
jgi:chromosome segregation ATPase